MRANFKKQIAIPQDHGSWVFVLSPLLIGIFAGGKFNATALILGWMQIIPQLVFLSFLAQWLETVWGITHPAIGWKPTRIGVRQLVVSIIWTILFIVCWRI
jgi:hypothetical protein